MVNGCGVQICGEANNSVTWGSLWLVAWVFGSDGWASDSELAYKRLIFELENWLRKEKKKINFLPSFNIRGCNLMHSRFVSNLLLADLKCCIPKLQLNKGIGISSLFHTLLFSIATNHFLID
jgi:hypothetical protein